MSIGRPYHLRLDATSCSLSFCRISLPHPEVLYRVDVRKEVAYNTNYIHLLGDISMNYSCRSSGPPKIAVFLSIYARLFHAEGYLIGDL